MPIKEETSNLEIKVNQALQTELGKVKDEVAIAANKLKPEQHLRHMLNTLDQHLNQLKDEAKEL